MANAITRQVLQNGSRNYTVHVTITGDGSGEESNTRVNAATGDMGTANKLMVVQASLSGCSAVLSWDATTKVKAVDLVSDKDTHLDFTRWGGLINNAGTGVTGDILITTSGLGSGDIITLTLHLKKT